MKRILAVALIGTLLTGCAQIGENLSNNLRRNMMSSIDVAKEDCLEMGFKQGSTQYQNCVMTTAHNIRTNREIQSAASTAASNAAERVRLNQPVQQVNQGYRNYDCRARLGGRVECTGF